MIRPIEIFIVDTPEHYDMIREDLQLNHKQTAILITQEAHGNPYFHVRGIESAVVWDCADWWHWDDPNVYREIMQIPEVEFVNYQKNLNLANF